MGKCKLFTRVAWLPGWFGLVSGCYACFWLVSGPVAGGYTVGTLTIFVTFPGLAVRYGVRAVRGGGGG